MNSASNPSSSHDALNGPRPDHGEGDSIDMQGLIATLLGGLPMLVGAILFALACSVFYLFVTSPSYTADALIQVEDKANSARFAFMEMGGAMPETPVAAEVEILSSRLVIGRVVERLGLDIVAAPSTFPIVGDGFARLFKGEGFGTAPWYLKPLNRAHYSWGGETIKISTLDLPESWIGPPLTVIAGEEGRYVLRDQRNDLILEGQIGKLETAPLQGTNARNEEDYAAPQINIFIQQLNARPGTIFTLQRQPRDIAIRRIQNNLAAAASRTALGIVTLTFSDNDPAKARQILDEILTVYQAQNVDRRSAEAEQTLSFLNEQLPQMKKEVEAAEAKLNKFKIENSTADLTQETGIVLQRSVELDQRRAELDQQRNEALQRFTENHPVVQAIDSQIAQLNIERSRINNRVRQLPEIEQVALQLQRDLQVSTALYVALLNRTQELEVVKSGTIGSIRIIDSPLTPRHPSKPKKGLVVALSIVLGGLLGVVFVFVREALRSGVEDPAETERRLGLATYGSIPYSPVQGRLAKLLTKSNSKGTPLILATEDPTSVTMEAFRGVRTALHFARMDAANNVVMLTGPAPDLGKSFVSVNLGAVLAQAGDRTLVIDADMRRGHIHKMLGFADRSPGLSDVLSGSTELSGAIRTTSVDGMFVMTTGQVPPNPSELLINPRFANMLKTLSEQFTHVIIDTPPVLAVTDAAVVGKHAGITLVVLKAGEHPMRMIEDTVSRLERSGVAVKGSLFNQVGLNRKGRYGYKYGYRYGYYQYEYGNKTGKGST